MAAPTVQVPAEVDAAQPSSVPLEGARANENFCPTDTVEGRFWNTAVSPLVGAPDASFAPMSHFDQSANQWDTPDKIAWTERYAQAIRSRVAPGRRIRLLDVGCGTGLLSFHFAPVADAILGIDTSPGMLEVFDAKAKATPQARSLLLDLEAHDLPAGATFDLVVSSMAFHHLVDPAAVLKKLGAALADGGRIAILDLDQEDGTFHPDPARMGVKHFGFSEAAARDWAARAGLELLTREIVHVIEKGEGRRYPIFMAVFGR